LQPGLDLEAERARLPMASGRWRWIVTAEETRTTFSEEQPPVLQPIALSVSPVRVGSQNWDARFKTLSYLSHAQAGRTVFTPEAILLNEYGHVASASRANIFWRRDNSIYTPAHEAGCRCGVVRSFVLAREKVNIGHFPLSELLIADEIFLANSMKGIVSVNEVEGRPINTHPIAEKLRRDYDGIVEAHLVPPSYLSER
jgi:4-amino-4-deoxychorismate lyase